MDENRIKGAVRNVEGQGGGGGRRAQWRYADKAREGNPDQGVGKVQSAVGRAIHELGGTAIADRAASFVKQATTVGESAVSAVQDATQQAGAQASDFGERLYDESRRAGQSIDRTIEDQPLATVLIVAAIGSATRSPISCAAADTGGAPPGFRSAAASRRSARPSVTLRSPPSSSFSHTSSS
jgi:hypothetical protein